MSLTKKRKAVVAKVDKNKFYSLKDASALVKEINCTKFDSSVDLHIRLGVDPKKANQMVRGVVALPHGTGKSVRVLALVPAEKEAEAKEELEKQRAAEAQMKKEAANLAAFQVIVEEAWKMKFKFMMNGYYQRM